MKIEFSQNDKALIVSINGEIDHHTSSEIRQKVDREVGMHNRKNLIFDFGKVSFMDSSGIGVMIGRYKNIWQSGGKMSIVNLSPQNKRIFEMSGLFKIIPHYETIEQAIKNI